MFYQRACVRPTCGREAVFSFVYNYSEQFVTIGPLCVYPVPECYDLCVEHAKTLKAPRGWQVFRHPLVVRASVDNEK